MTDKKPKQPKRVKGKGPKFKATFTPTHVIVGFEGFNAPLIENAGEELPADMPDNRVVDILNKSAAGFGEQVKKQAYSTDVTEQAKSKAAEFIRANMKVVDGKQRGKLILYGYSMGGDTAIELARDLKGEFVVDLLVTVDVATGGNIGADREISDNVIHNVNFWTATPETYLFQSGSENKADNPQVTSVQNFLIEGANHGSIYQKTKDRSIELIRKELQDTRYSSVFHPIKLIFTGKELRIVTAGEGKELTKYKAMSGLPPNHKHLRDLIKAGRTDLVVTNDYTQPAYQDVADAGPIPEDVYELPLTSSMEYQKTSADGPAWGVGGWRLEAGLWNDVGTKLFGGRSGFYLHEDGRGPGTAGCIGVSPTGNMAELKKRLQDAFAHGQDSVEVQVSYER